MQKFELLKNCFSLPKLYLPETNEKIKDKLIADVKQRVTSVKHVLGKDTSFDDVASAIKDGFEKEFNVELVDGTLTETPEEVAVRSQAAFAFKHAITAANGNSRQRVL